MPGLEVWIPVVLAIVTPALAGVGWWFKAWRDDRTAREARHRVVVDVLEARNDKLQGKVESLLMDAIAREREANAQMIDRIAMDRQQNVVAAAMTVALKEATAALTKPKDVP